MGEAHERGEWWGWAWLLIPAWILFQAISTPSFRGARASAREKACYCNIRIVQSSLEMYNMDHVAMLNSIDPTAMRILNTAVGTVPAYLKQIPTCPGSGRVLDFPLSLFWAYEIPGPAGDYVGQNLLGDGVVSCTVHGGVD